MESFDGDHINAYFFKRVIVIVVMIMYFTLIHMLDNTPVIVTKNKELVVVSQHVDYRWRGDRLEDLSIYKYSGLVQRVLKKRIK